MRNERRLATMPNCDRLSYCDGRTVSFWWAVNAHSKCSLSSHSSYPASQSLEIRGFSPTMRKCGTGVGPCRTYNVPDDRVINGFAVIAREARAPGQLRFLCSSFWVTRDLTFISGTKPCFLFVAHPSLNFLSRGVSFNRIGKPTHASTQIRNLW